MAKESGLANIYDKLEQLDISYREFEDLPALRELVGLAGSSSLFENPSEKSARISKRSLIVYLVPIILIGLLAFSAVHPYRPIPRLVSWTTLQLLPKDYERDECLLRAPPKFADWFRPPVNCSMCRRLTAVDSLNEITADKFTAEYAYSSRPLVVRGALKNWTASSTFSYDFLKKLYMKDFPGSLDVLDEHCQFFNYKTEFRNLRQFLSMSKERYEQMWYVGFSNCDVAVADALRRHYARPAFLPVGSESSRLDWIFIGKPGYGANLHVDNVGRSSWQAQIRGVKEWTLEPPPECYFECAAMKVKVYPNDIIVVDTDTWYHSTLILGDEVSITIGSEFD